MSTLLTDADTRTAFWVQTLGGFSMGTGKNFSSPGSKIKFDLKISFQTIVLVEHPLSIQTITILLKNSSY